MKCAKNKDFISNDTVQSIGSFIFVFSFAVASIRGQLFDMFSITLFSLQRCFSQIKLNNRNEANNI